MKTIYNDGGRELAGYKGFTGDCVVRSIAIVTGKPYQDVYNTFSELCRGTKSHPRKGVSTAIARKYLLSIGFTWVPYMGIGTGCTVHLKEGELPPGKLICKVSKHFCAVIDGVIHDTYNPSREGTRCVYGYFIKKF